MVLSSSLQSLTTRPLILQHRRSSRFFLTSHHQWRHIQNQNNGVPSLGLSHLQNRHPPSLNPPLPLRRRLLLPRSPLHPLLRPRPPPLRHLSLASSMTTTTTTTITAHAAAVASHSSDSSSATKTVRVVIKGRVQGVFYRNWTIDNANELGLRGWVRNRRDGSVEALFSGNQNSVDEMQLRCRRGPPAAVVTGLEVFPSSDDPGSGFDRKPTV